jgi:hypothetical protein
MSTGDEISAVMKDGEKGKSKKQTHGNKSF